MSSRRRLLDHYGFFAEIVHVDSERPGDLIIEEREDCEPIVGAAKILADQPPGREFRHAAYIPQHVLNQAFREGWFHDKAAWKKWANAPENAKFRTWRGRL